MSFARRLVLDTGVLVSAAIRPDSVSGRCSKAAGFAQNATTFPVRRSTVREINSAIDFCRRRVDGR